MAYSLDDLLNPQVSKVTRSTDNLIITTYGARGQGKTPVATKMEKPFYFAFGKSGLSGINNVDFHPVNSWSDFKSLVKLFSLLLLLSLLLHQEQSACLPLLCE